MTHDQLMLLLLQARLTSTVLFQTGDNKKAEEIMDLVQKIEQAEKETRAAFDEKLRKRGLID